MSMPTLRMIACRLLVVLMIGLWASGAHAQTTRTVRKSGDWTVYEHQAGTARICFASTPAKSSSPKGFERGLVQLFISSWPRDGVKGEISVKLGYVAKKGAPVTVRIGDVAFSMFTAGDRAFMQDATLELKLIEALRKGQSLTVEATSDTAAETIDTFSLQGVTQALQTVAAGCA
jgi:invasion protein IalB